MGNFITESNVYSNLFMCDSHEKVVKFPYLIIEIIKFELIYSLELNVETWNSICWQKNRQI